MRPLIKITPYQESWSTEFEEIAKQIREAVGPSALAIHHIGSTSIPYLAAKDKIDIQITVADLEAPITAPLEKIGFEATEIKNDHCPPGLSVSKDDLEKRFFRQTDRAVNLHVRKQGTFNQEYPILFRDYLRAHPMARDAYGEVKKKLAKYFPKNIDAYYDIKDPVCDIIISNAIEWSKTSNYTIAPTDA